MTTLRDIFEKPVDRAIEGVIKNRTGTERAQLPERSYASPLV
jgi:hypothetical protein